MFLVSGAFLTEPCQCFLRFCVLIRQRLHSESGFFRATLYIQPVYVFIDFINLSFLFVFSVAP